MCGCCDSHAHSCTLRARRAWRRGGLSGQRPCASGPSLPRKPPGAAAAPHQTAHTSAAPAAPCAAAAAAPLIPSPPAAPPLSVPRLLRPLSVHLAVEAADRPPAQQAPALSPAAAAAAAARCLQQGGAALRTRAACPPTLQASKAACSRHTTRGGPEASSSTCIPGFGLHTPSLGTVRSKITLPPPGPAHSRVGLLHCCRGPLLQVVWGVEPAAQ